MRGRTRKRNPYHKAETYVYLLRGGVTNLYKIGIARNVAQRIGMLMEWPDWAGTPDYNTLHPVVEIRSLLMPTRSLAYRFERALHRRYRVVGVGSEWFEFEADYVADVLDIFAVTRWLMLSGMVDVDNVYDVPHYLTPRATTTVVDRGGFWTDCLIGRSARLDALRNSIQQSVDVANYDEQEAHDDR